VNSVLASDEARRNLYDEAIFLKESGHVAEGATCNLFIVRNGKLVTPPGTDNILEGITRASVMDLARKEMGLEVLERSIGRSESLHLRRGLLHRYRRRDRPHRPRRPSATAKAAPHDEAPLSST
jgi:hypothetical protein